MSEIVQLRLIEEEEKQADVPLPVILRQPDLLSAVNLSLNYSGKDDKVLCLECGIDPGNWSSMRKGIKHFPANKYETIMRTAGNIIPLVYLAHQFDHELKPHEDSKDKQISTLLKKLAEQDIVINTLSSLVRR